MSDSCNPMDYITHQALLSMGFSRQEYWSGLPFPPTGIFPTKGSNPGLLHCRQILYNLSHQGSLWLMKLLLIGGAQRHLHHLLISLSLLLKAHTFIFRHSYLHLAHLQKAYSNLNINSMRIEFLAIFSSLLYLQCSTQGLPYRKCARSICYMN